MNNLATVVGRRVAYYENGKERQGYVTDVVAAQCGKIVFLVADATRTESEVDPTEVRWI